MFLPCFQKEFDMKPSIGREIRSLNNLIRRYFDSSPYRNEVEAATENNGWIIGFLAQNAQKDVYQKDIEAHFTITRSTASRVLSLMVRKGLVQRQAVSQDARLKKIVLTEKAWKIERLMREDLEQMEQTLLQGFTEDEIHTLSAWLQRMKENISAGR